MAIEVDLIVEAITKGFDKISDDIDRVDKSVGDAGKTASQSGTRWTEMASKINVAKEAFSQVAQVAGQVYSAIKEGAQLEMARAQFDNLAASIGTTSDALLNDMGAATHGMLSNAQMIDSASQLISLGLAKTQEETVRLATAVSTLGLDMQQVILTFANNSTARLDALGLSIEDVTTKAQELEAQGFQGDAFDEAVLIALEQKMTLLGDASQTTAGQLQQLEASWANLTDSSKQWLALNMAPTINGLSQTVDALNGSIASQRSGWDNFRIIVGETGKALSGTDTVWGAMIEDAKEMDAALVKTNEQFDKQADLLAQNTEAATAADEMLLRLVDTTTYFAEATAGADAVLMQTVSTYQENAAAAQHLAEKQAELAESSNVVRASTEAEAAQLMRMQEAGILAAQGITAIIPAANSVTGAVDRSSLALEKLLGYMGSLDGRSVSANVTVNIDEVGSGPGVGNSGASGSGKGNSGKSGQDGSTSYGGSGGGKGYDPPSYAVGTDGWQTVPGPMGAPYPVTLHGGESFNVRPNGGTGGLSGPLIGQVIMQPGENVNAFADRTADRLASALRSRGAL